MGKISLIIGIIIGIIFSVAFPEVAQTINDAIMPTIQSMHFLKLLKPLMTQ